MTAVLEGHIPAGYADLVMGTGWGDEGKGIEAARRVATGNYGVGTRFNGGANAGHERGDITLNQVPCSVGEVDYNLLANGSLVDPELLVSEFDIVLKGLGFRISPDNFGISDTAHLVLPHHKILDGVRESSNAAQGSTIKGIAFVAADKYRREGVRGELLTWDPTSLAKIALKGLRLSNLALLEAGKEKIVPEEEFERWLPAANSLIPFMVDSIPLLHSKLKSGINVLLEGAQAIGLDMEFGIYPLGTSSHTGTGGALNGTGINHHYLRKIVGVGKIPGSRVGGKNGPFPTKIKDEEIAGRLRGKRGDIDSEYGKVSNREREIGNPDLVPMRHAVEVAGITEFVLTKLDKLPLYGDTVRVAYAYDMKGERRYTMPNSAIKLAACKPIYRTFKNSREDISSARDYCDLPDETIKIIEFIEEVLETPVTTLGVGPHKDQVIMRRKSDTISSNGSKSLKPVIR